MLQQPNKFTKIIKELYKLSNRERLIVAIMVCWLVIGAIGKRLLSFRTIANALGQHGLDPKLEFSLKEKHRINNLRNLFSKVAFTLPIHTTCLVRAFAIAQIFKWQQIPYTVFIGVTFGPKKTIKAHAWVRCGDIPVIGDNGSSDFAIISTFGKTF